MSEVTQAPGVNVVLAGSPLPTISHRTQPRNICMQSRGMVSMRGDAEAGEPPQASNCAWESMKKWRLPHPSHNSSKTFRGQTLVIGPTSSKQQ
eukprot:4143175-Amphidinium_carterae.1